MNPQKRHAFTLLAWVLLIGISVRIVPALFEIQIGRDISEYKNIANNLQRGRGFTSGIKAFHAVDTPVVHYAGYERPLLLPFCLRIMSAVFSPKWGAQFFAPLVFLLILVFLFDLIRAAYSAEAAFCVTSLIALHPGLLEISLKPLTEILTLFFFTLALWSWFKMKSPILTGIACALAFLARPSTALMGLLLFGLYFIEAKRSNSFRPLVKFSLAAVAGPLVLVAVNIGSHAPAFLTPQSFLFRVVSYTDKVHYFHQNPSYSSTLGLLWHQNVHVPGLIIKNLFHYVKACGSSIRGMVFILPFLPLAFYSLGRRDAKLPWIAGLIGVVDFTLYAVTWSTFDAERFTALLYLAVLMMAGIGLWLFSSRIEFKTISRPSMRMLVFVPLLVLFAVPDLMRSYIAFKEYRVGLDYSNNLEAVWNRSEVRTLAGKIGELKSSGALATDTIVASNEPWLINAMTGMPAVLIPYDLRPEEWIPFLEKYRASAALLHIADWPRIDHESLLALRESLAKSGWRAVFQEGALEFWIKGAA